MYVEGEMPSTTNASSFDGGSWWVVIILFALIFGWGNNGLGGRNSTSSSGAYDNYVLSSDFATIQRQLSDGFGDLRTTGINLGNGISNLGYTEQTLINGVNTNIIQGNYDTQTAINSLGTQMQNCCCTTQRAIDGVNYNMATNSNAINTNIATASRDIIENANANYRALHDELVAQRLETKDEKIAEQQAIINSLQLSASQQAQNNYLVNALRPAPTPAYVVQNPYYYGSNFNGTTIQ